MSRISLFKRDASYAVALESLTPRQRLAYMLFAAGGILPLLLLALIRPVFWVAAIQLACVAGLAYIRWRAPALKGSFILFSVAAFASLVAGIAAIAA